MADQNTDLTVTVKSDSDGVTVPTRRADGTFLPGNTAAKGNVFAKRVAELRQHLFKAVDDGEWDKVIKMLIEDCTHKDAKVRSAARFELFNRLLGKPMQQIDMNVTGAALTPEEMQERIKQILGA